MDEQTTSSNEERIYLDLLEQLKTLDLKNIAATKNLPLLATGKVTVKSFARTYLISRDGITAADNNPVSFGQKMSVISFILSEYTGPPAFDFIPFSHLGGYNIGREKHMNKNAKQPILNTFSDNYDLFTKAALKIGGIEKENVSAGKHIWLF